VDFDRLISFEDGSDLWGPNRDSASLARATLQKPICAVLPAARLIG
jgi:hypothetical protein